MAVEANDNVQKVALHSLDNLRYGSFQSRLVN